MEQTLGRWIYLNNGKTFHPDRWFIHKDRGLELKRQDRLDNFPQVRELEQGVGVWT